MPSKNDRQTRRISMIIPKLGLMMLFTGAAGLAQQPPPSPQRPPVPVVQAPQQTPVTETERRRFEEIKSRRDRGETISPEDQRFAQEVQARLDQEEASQRRRMPLNDAERKRLEEIRARMNRGETISPEDQRFFQEMRPRISPVPRVAARPLPPQKPKVPAIQAPRPMMAMPPAQRALPPLERALGVPGGKWWTRPEMAQKLGLTAEQIKKMDDTFQQYRLKLIDLNAAVQREETIMEPLVAAEQPDEAKIVAQIDKVAQARAELEKANARMLLGIRRLLTPEQWNKLKAEPPVTPQPFRR
jgi:Spy/CpxP family protein refolding chaperone